VLCAAVGASRCLAVLDCSHCDMTCASGAHWGAALKAAPPALVTLRLRGNPLGSVGVTHLAAGLGAVPSLRHMDLCHTSAGDSGAACLAEALRTCGVTHLLLDGCDISHVGAAALGSATTSRPSGLAVLSLGGNPGIGDVGALALAGAHVDELDVGGCSITGVGAAALVGPTVVMTHLSLLGNALGDAGITALAAAVALPGAAPRLSWLSVSGTAMGFQGAEALMEVLCSGGGPQLTHLECGSNPFADGSDACTALVTRLRDTRGDINVAWRASDPGTDSAK
jgi:Leucine Rich repeat